MPCYDTSPPPSNHQIVTDKEYKELKAKLDAATRVACGVFDIIEDIQDGIIDRNCVGDHLTNEMNTWIRDHREADEKRKIALIASIRAKLTSEEREVLGL